MRARVLILYFSGTGNTDYVARYLAERLVDLPVEVSLASIERQPPEAASGFDVLAFGFPVYECDAPRFVRDYLQQIAPGGGRGAFVFCTKGAWAGNAVRRNLQRLDSRGFVPLGGASVSMPGTDGLPFLSKRSWMARAALSKDYDSLRAADRLLKRLAYVLAGLGAGEPAEVYRQRLPLSLGGALLDWLWAGLYDLFGDSMRSRFWADERCTRCDLCLKLCPTGNVAVEDGHPRFGDGCVLCMRCIHACPAEAIQIGRGTVDKFRWRGPKGDFRPLKLRPTASEAPPESVATKASVSAQMSSEEKGSSTP